MTTADLRPDPRDIALEAARERLQQVLNDYPDELGRDGRKEVADTIKLIDATLSAQVSA